MVCADRLFDVNNEECKPFRAMAARTPLFAAEVVTRFAKKAGDRLNSTSYRCPGRKCPVTFRIAIKLGPSAFHYCARCAWIGTLSDLKWQDYRTMSEEMVIEAHDDGKSTSESDSD